MQRSHVTDWDKGNSHAKTQRSKEGKNILRVTSADYPGTICRSYPRGMAFGFHPGTMVPTYGAGRAGGAGADYADYEKGIGVRVP